MSFTEYVLAWWSNKRPSKTIAVAAAAVVSLLLLRLYSLKWLKKASPKRIGLARDARDLRSSLVYPFVSSAKALDDAKEIVFDYVIVGGGSAGAVIASRLSEDPSKTVLLIEAGTDAENDPRVNIPGLFAETQKNDLDWNYMTTRQPETKSRIHYWPRGKVLGGCSATNAMLYVRCSPADYDEWESVHGCAGWNHNNVLPYFVKSEGVDIGDDHVDKNLHGSRGPLKVTLATSGDILPCTRAFIVASQIMGVGKGPDGTNAGKGAHEVKKLGDDYNGKSQLGVGISQMTISSNGVRCTTRHAFLPPELLRSRSNLRVLTRHMVTRLAVNHSVDAEQPLLKSVNGVYVRSMPAGVAGTNTDKYGPEWFIKAGKEVILSAGAIGSPTILLHSGIGPANDLRSVGISVNADLPGVGQNLQDHLTVPVYQLDKSRSVYRSEVSKIVPGLYNYFFRGGKGLLSASLVEGMSFFNILKNEIHHKRQGPNIQIHLLNAAVDPPQSENINLSSIIPSPISSKHTLAFNMAEAKAGVEWMRKKKEYHQFAQLVTLLHPYSRGTIKLASNDPCQPPLIDPRTLADERDIKMFIAGARECIKVADEMKRVDPVTVGDVVVDEYILAEVKRILGTSDDKAGLENDLYWEEYVRRNAATLYHPVGTCKMGDVARDPTAVVNATDLKVKGFSNLRIVDASIMPDVPSGNTNAPSIMIGEVASDMIKGLWKH